MTKLNYAMLKDAAGLYADAGLTLMFGPDFWKHAEEGEGLYGSLSIPEAEAIFEDSAYEIAAGLYAVIAYDPLESCDVDDLVFSQEEKEVILR